MRRKGNTLVVSVIVPCFLVGLASTFYYFLPKGAGERANYLATILLTEIMFLVMVSQIVPMSTQIPFIGYFFLSISCATIFLILIVLLIDKKERQLERIKYKKRKARKEQKEKLKEEKDAINNNFDTQNKDILETKGMQEYHTMRRERLIHSPWEAANSVMNGRINSIDKESFSLEDSPADIVRSELVVKTGSSGSLRAKIELAPIKSSNWNYEDLFCLKINHRKKLRKLDQIIAIFSTVALTIMMAAMMGVILK